MDEKKRMNQFCEYSSMLLFAIPVSLLAPATLDTYISLPFPDILNPPKGLWAFKAL